MPFLAPNKCYAADRNLDAEPDRIDEAEAVGIILGVKLSAYSTLLRKRRRRRMKSISEPT